MKRPRPARNPLDGCRRLLIDGSNQRDQASQPLPEEALVGPMRALFASTIEIVVVFDTDPPIGSSSVRSVAGVTVRHAGPGRGDDLLCAIASHAPDGTLVVTDDNDLRRRVVELGARIERNDWLRRWRERGCPQAASIGRRLRGPTGGVQDVDGSAEGDADDRGRWRPGRGATVKHGAARRRPKRR